MEVYAVGILIYLLVITGVPMAILSMPVMKYMREHQAQTRSNGHGQRI